MTLMQRRRALMAVKSKDVPILPAEYQAVEYISKSSGNNNYIDTGISLRNIYPTTFDGKIRRMGGGAYDGYAMNMSTPSGSPTFAFNVKSDAVGIVNGGNKYFPIQEATGNNDLVFSVYVTASNFHTEVLVGGQTYSADTAESPSAWDSGGATFRVGWRAGSGSMFGRFYYIRVSQNGKTAIDLIPCYRKSDDTIGMYDYVSRSFFPATGTWTKGADV